MGEERKRKGRGDEERKRGEDRTGREEWRGEEVYLVLIG